MLTPKYLESLPDAVLELYSKAEQDILADMARRISTYDYWIPAADWQNQKLLEAGHLQEEITKTLSRYTGRTEAELKRLMREAANKTLQTDGEVYQSVGLNVPSIAKNQALIKTLNAGFRATNQTMKNLTRTTARTATRQFERELDRAWMKITSGAFSADAAVASAVKELSRQGVGSITYPSGHTDTIETATRRAVVTGVNQTCGRLQLELADELGCDLMEITAHAGARPSHAEWQGQIVSRSKQKGYLSLDDIGYGSGDGFKGWNCRHDWNPYFEGMPRTWTDDRLRELNATKYEYNGQKMTEYEASQRQRYIERQIRRWKRENLAMDAAGLDTSESAAKLRRWQDTQQGFLSQTGLKRQSGREQVAGWGRSQTSLAKAEAKHITLTNAAGQRIIKMGRTMPRDIPGSITQVESIKGGISRNYYGQNGQWSKQVTNNNHGNQRKHPYGKNGEHAHDIVWKDGKIIDRPARELTEWERKENADIL